MHYLLFYEKGPNHAEREKLLMAAHRLHLHAAIDRGALLLGGPIHNPTDGTNVLLFDSNSAAAAEQFAADDPYVRHGVVVRWQVRKWETVVGPLAACRLSGFETSGNNKVQTKYL